MVLGENGVCFRGEGVRVVVISLSLSVGCFYVSGF